MDVANPPSPVQIEAIGFSRSKAKNCFYLNEPLESMEKHSVFWVLLIKYDKFSGKLTRLVHFCAKMCKKPCVFNSFWTFDSMFDHKWVWSLSKLCSVQHCKAGWARPVFSILGKDKRDPNETVFCSLDVSQGLHFKAVQSNRSYRIWDCFYLNEPLENMQKHRFFWVLLINYDNFSGKLTRIVHFCAKMCKKPCVLNSFWTFDSMFDHKWVWSLSKLCSVQHCKAGWARPVFSILGKDKRDPNETVFCSLDVSLRSPLQSSPIK